MFKDKLFLVMLVLGLLTIVAAAGVVTTQRGNGQEQNPYVDMQEQGDFIARQPEGQIQEAKLPETAPSPEEKTEITAEQLAENNLDTVTAEKTKEEAGRPEEEKVQEAGAGSGNVEALALNFSDTSRLSWPVRGNVVLNTAWIPQFIFRLWISTNAIRVWSFREISVSRFMRLPMPV